ncbi:MAG TPA: N-acetyl-gamma-glutamyl-phosphate reductase, partial [Armatimonadetes bacterium]|nr:N-acetyl-gamma-glutamyl-phosphate reductase [Armatimonadota bacterium]
MPIRVGIVGATGYTGGELMRFLLAHPEAQLVHLMRLTSEESIPVTRVHPALRGIVEVECHALDETALTVDVDVVFLAVPHRAALQVAPALLDAGIRVVDLSADFRFKDASIYEAWYEVKHTALEWLQKAVYGLPELHRDAIRTAQLVANPGCYPISAILALLPLLRNQLVQLDSIVIDSKSGVSGAGRSKLSLDYHYPEVFGDFRA